jgi:hypothetical protein
MDFIGATELLILAMLGVFVVPFWKIFAKAGFPGALSLTQLVPILNVIVLFYVAFSEWPIQQQLNQSRLGSRPEPI